MVAVASLAINHRRDQALSVCVIDCGLSARNRGLLEDSLRELCPQATIVFRVPDCSRLAGLRVETAGLFTYARLISSDLFPEIDRAIYLDTDVVVNRDLSELFDVDLGGFPIGAVQDRFTPVASHPLSILDWEKRGMSANDPFFNAGVLLIDYEKWRADKIGERAIEFARANKEICVRWDQTALNILLHKQWKPLERHWNYMVYSNIEETWETAGKNFHITGQPKQWDIAPRTNSVLQEMFFGYMDRTKMSGWRPWTVEKENSVRLMIQKCFPRLHLKWKIIRPKIFAPPK